MTTSNLTGVEPVAKKGDLNTTVKIRHTIYRKAKVIAAHRDIDLSEYLSDLLAKPVDRDYEKTRKEMDGASAEERD